MTSPTETARRRPSGSSGIGQGHGVVPVAADVLAGVRGLVAGVHREARLVRQGGEHGLLQQVGGAVAVLQPPGPIECLCGVPGQVVMVSSSTGSRRRGASQPRVSAPAALRHAPAARPRSRAGRGRGSAGGPVRGDGVEASPVPVGDDPPLPHRRGRRGRGEEVVGQPGPVSSTLRGSRVSRIR